MKTKTILSVLCVLAWLGVVGYAVKLGSQAISFGVSFLNPVAAEKIPGTAQNLTALLQHDFWQYVCVMSLVIAVSAMSLSLWYSVSMLLTKLNVDSPFTAKVSKKMERIAYSLLSIWIVSFIGEKYVNWLSKTMDNPLDIINASSESLFTAGIVYIISQIFKRGVELQQEQDLTI
ncbi:MAG: DUF2975 domain-containing protein [Saprospiraceae bacterium]